jgi:hypothetical protein
MHARDLVVKSGTIAVVFLGLAGSSQAQIGSGWSTMSWSRIIQKTGSNAYYSNSGGVETFRISPGDTRSEVQMWPMWTSGSHQFEGYVSPSGTIRSAGASVQQTVERYSGVGDVNQVRIKPDNGGTLYVLQNGVTLGTSCFGVYKRINIIHYRSTGKIETWINGSKKSTLSDIGSGSYYFKYGIYIAPSSGSSTAKWKGIRLWSK